MLSCLVSLWMTVAVGQAQPEAAWLKAVPADVPVVVRGRALETVRDDLLAMIGAMSPASATPAKEGLAPGLQMVEGMFGKAMLKAPSSRWPACPTPRSPRPPSGP